MAEVVDNVLQEIAKREATYGTIEVIKQIDDDIDEGNLMIVDKNPLDNKKLRSRREDYIAELTRDNTQLLINTTWKLPVKKIDDIVTVQLPPPTTPLPREKPVPQPKAPTKWEQYAQLKGIQKRKQGRKVFDETSKEWKPRWGYKRANDDTKDWLIEVPDNADPYEDQYQKRMKAKKERVAKNELHRLRNLARHMKGKVPGVGLTPTDKPDQDYLGRALAGATHATASLGKFTKTLPKEKQNTKGSGKKRKFLSNAAESGSEKKRALDILKRVQGHKPLLNMDKAVNRQVHEDNEARRQKKSGAPVKRSKKGSVGKTGKKRFGTKGANFGSKTSSSKAQKKGANKALAGQGRKGGNKR